MTTVMDRLAWLLVVMITGQALLHGRGGAVLGDGLISFDFPDFSNSSSLPINFLYSATATPDGQGISLCLNSQPGTSAGMMWYSLPIQVRGFSMTFNYTVSDFSKSSQRRDGMAFVIQTEGPNAFGPGGAGLGYGDTNDGDGKGITKSVAIEFDSFYDPTLLDPYSFHISVHTNQNLGANSANESYSVWMTEQPGITLSTQVITINYVPWPTVRGLGLMSVVYNGFNLGSFNLTLDKLVALDAVEGSAYVGFTGSHSPSNGTFPGETITINSWSFAFTGKIQASSCLIFGLDYAEAGAGLVFYLQAVDNFGYNMTTDSILASGLTPLVTLTEPNSALQNGTITYSSMGLYKLFVNATISGNATVNVFLGNQRIGPGAYSLSVFPTVPNPATTYSYGVAPQATAGSIGSFWVQLRDVYNNNVTTNASVPTVLITGTDFSQPATVTFDPTGRYLVEYNVTLSGAFAIGVALNGSPTSDPSYPLQVIPAALDPSTSLAYGMSLTVVAGTLQTVLVQLRDVFGNNVTDATANVTLSIVLDAIEVFGTGTDLGGGLYSFTYNATTMGTYNLVPLVNGVPLSQLTGYYTPITVAPASVNPAVSYAYGAGLTQGTAGYLAVLYVQLTDTFGNNVSVPNIQVRAELVDYPDVQPSTTPVGTNAGLFMISYNVTVASTYTLQVQAQGTIVTYGSSTVTIQPAEVDPVSCVAFGTGLTGADLVVGNLNAFSVQLRDRYLNNITTPEAPLDVVITDLLSSSAVYNVTPIFESGAYQVSYNITLASDYQVSLTVSGDPILNPITNLTLAPGAINPPTCVATGDLGTDAVAGTLRVFQVQLRDVYSNNIVTVDPSTTIVTAQFTNPNLAVPIAITYTEAGIYSCSYNATVTGSYTLDILVLGAAIANGNTPVQVVAAPAYPPYCMAQGQALTGATAGALVSFSIYLYDVFNNSIPPTILAPVVSVTTPTEQTVDVTPDETQGIYTATYNITQSATYTVDITIGGVQIGTPPASLVINPAPLYVPNCIASGSTLTGTAGTQGAITLLQRDVFGNNIKDYTQVTGVTFEMTLASDPTIKANTSQPDQNGDGSYALSYDITLAGNYVTGISINNVNILGSPFTTVVNPANFDPHGTATVGLETNVVAGNNNSFSVQLRDVYGNDITENVVAPDNITLLLNGAEVENTEITLVGDGIYDIVYNQTVAGTYTMNITIDHVEIGTTPLPQIIITPAGTYPPNCYAVGEATLKAFIKRDNSYTLVVRDQFYNHCNGSTIPPVIQLSATGEQTVVGSAVLNPDGNYTITYSGITAKATFTMSVTFNGEHISGSPFAVESQYSNSAPNTVMIVGIVLGCVAFVGIAAFFGYRMYKKRHGGYEYLA